jgi:hypothetical protein
MGINAHSAKRLPGLRGEVVRSFNILQWRLMVLAPVTELPVGVFDFLALSTAGVAAIGLARRINRGGC